MRSMADDAALIAHLLRRLTFGPRPGQVDELLPLGVAGALEHLLAAVPLDVEEPQLGTGDDYTVMRLWWRRLLADPGAGLHEKITWFWHGHLTSSLAKAEPALMLIQHRLLRRLAVGNLRELLQEITVDPAMLEWLDGSGSTAEAPNENYSRELMELFALGRGNFTEADVRAGAIALAGWGVQYEGGVEAYFDESLAPSEPVEFLGRSVLRADEVVDAVCDSEACSAHIAARLYEFLVGQPPDEARLGELAIAFRDSGLEIRILIEAIARHPSFLEARLNRPRTGIEWFIAAQSFLDREFEEYRLYELGHVPFEPPNVAGWPGPDRWVSTGAVLSKAASAWDFAGDTPTFETDDPVAEVLAKASLYEISDETRNVLRAAADSVDGRREKSSLLHALVPCTPEFNLA